MIYHDATKSFEGTERLQADHTPFRIRIGIKYAEGHRIAVVVHFDGGQCDYDCDAFLHIDEAVEIRDALTRAIADALRGGTQLVTRL